MLTDSQIVNAVSRLRTGRGLIFQSRGNRDAVYRAAKASGLDVYKRSGVSSLTTNYVFDLFAPDKGLGNDWTYGTFYHLETSRY